MRKRRYRLLQTENAGSGRISFSEVVCAVSSFSQLRKDAIKRGMAEMLNIQSEIFTPGSHSANVLAAIPRISVGMTIFDAKALETLPGLKRKRVEAEQREEQLKKEAQKAKSLDF